MSTHHGMQAEIVSYVWALNQETMVLMYEPVCAVYI